MILEKRKSRNMKKESKNNLIQNHINPFHLKKQELLIFTTQKCKHRMPYHQHPQCFLNEIMQEGHVPKIGFLDLEFMNFNANYGILLTYAIKEYHKKKIYNSMISQKEIRSKDLDKNLTKRLIKDLSNFDVIVTYFGTRCDVPYMRTRALKWNIPFPSYGYIKHIDLYYLVKSKLSLNRNRLETACYLLGIHGKNHVIGDTWIRAVTGHEPSIRYILKHNKLDVIITEKLYDKMITFSAKTRRSI